MLILNPIFVVCMQVAYSSCTNLLEEVCSIEMGRNLSAIFHTLLWHFWIKFHCKKLCDLHQFRVSILVVRALSFLCKTMYEIFFLKMQCHFLKDN